MNKMADNIVKKTNEAEKELEKLVMNYQTQKEQKDENQERRKKELARMKNDEIKATLDKQLQEKKAKQLLEEETNNHYMK